MKKIKKNEIAYILRSIRNSKPGTKDGDIMITTAMLELSHILRSVGMETELQVSTVDMSNALDVFIHAMASGRHQVEGGMSTVGLDASGNIWVDGSNPANLAGILGYLANHHDLRWIKFCDHCGKLFVARNSKGKFCSAKCKNRRNYLIKKEADR